MNAEATNHVTAEMPSPKMDVNEFVKMLGMKDNFKTELVAQVKRDISVLEQLGMGKKEVAIAAGLAEVRKPRTAKPPVTPKPQAKGKAA